MKRLAEIFRIFENGEDYKRIEDITPKEWVNAYTVGGIFAISFFSLIFIL